MAQYVFNPDGSVTDGQWGKQVAFFDSDGTIKDSQFGRVIGFVSDDGTVSDQRLGKVLGVVASDGTVTNGPFNQTAVGHVGPPVYKRGALLLLLG